jgi:putative hydrolase of the HAD superfamily
MPFRKVDCLTMQWKAILVDVDGVLVVHPDPNGWSGNLESDLGISPSKLQEKFFDRHWNDVVNGRAALRDRLTPVLAEIAPDVSTSTLIEYWFANDAHLDQLLLTELLLLRSEGFELHLATVQEHERACYLWNHLGLRNSFDGMHYAAALGCSKPDNAFYRAVESAARLGAESIFFIDDRIENVMAARDCGWAAALWTNGKTVRDLMIEL